MQEIQQRWSLLMPTEKTTETRVLTDAEHDLVGGAGRDMATTLAVGEEDGGWCLATTMAIGEEEPVRPAPVLLGSDLHSKL